MSKSVIRSKAQPVMPRILVWFNPRIKAYLATPESGPYSKGDKQIFAGGKTEREAVEKLGRALADVKGN